MPPKRWYDMGMKTNFFISLALVLLTACLPVSGSDTSLVSENSDQRVTYWKQLSTPTGENALPEDEIAYYFDQNTCVGETLEKLKKGFFHAAPQWRTLMGTVIRETDAADANLVIVCTQFPKEYSAERRPYFLRAVEFNRDRSVSREVVEVAANWQIFGVNEDVLDWETYNPWAYSSMGAGYAVFGLMHGLVHKTAFWRGHRLQEFEDLQNLEIK